VLEKLESSAVILILESFEKYMGIQFLDVIIT
jgi:hypothetical protein